jgi:2-polyprenyl-6-hydroxyphenyl methylase/3-demethylubiquinone-9 3-methyltransferase
VSDDVARPAGPLPPLRWGTRPACKVCGAATEVFGAKDFNRNCEEGQGLRLPPRGAAVAYHRCGACGLIFTDAFDDWSDEDFATHIYGEGYAAVDPDYAERRPLNMAKGVGARFAGFRDRRVLDYGGGNGRFAEEMRNKGFGSVTTYDRFSPAFDRRPEGRFDLITAFETLEHMPDPLAGAADIAGLLAPGGVIVTSTLLQPAAIGEVGVEWWYIGPRNGHVTFHTRDSLAVMWGKQGLKSAVWSDNVQLAGEDPPRTPGDVAPGA